MFGNTDWLGKNTHIVMIVTCLTIGAIFVVLLVCFLCLCLKCTETHCEAHTDKSSVATTSAVSSLDEENGTGPPVVDDRLIEERHGDSFRVRYQAGRCHKVSNNDYKEDVVVLKTGTMSRVHLLSEWKRTEFMVKNGRCAAGAQVYENIV